MIFRAKIFRIEREIRYNNSLFIIIENRLNL